jgi:hypothetical protein
MKTTILGTKKFPTAYLAVNKGRVKLYNKEGEMPTYYLQGGQEFQIELFNPTQNTILAKIILNGKPISQGGLVLRPGVRVFLDRYLDVAKKFLFDTYEVSGTNDEVKEAIEKNGDFKVQFFNESIPKPNYFSNLRTLGNITKSGSFGGPSTGNVNTYYSDSSNTPINNSYTTTSLSNFHDGMASMDWMSQEQDRTLSLNNSTPEPRKKLLRSVKSIETGRVEKGSDSNQQITSVDLDFEFIAFHTIQYKMLPVSQKVNEVGEIFIKRYCTNCGSKLTKGDKFCSNCGTRA